MREAKRSSEIFYLSNLSTLGKPTKIIQLDTLINILYYLRIQIGRYPRTFLVDYFPISHFILFLQIQHIRSSSPLSLVTPRLIMDERSHSTACVSPGSRSPLPENSRGYRLTFCSMVWHVGPWSNKLDMIGFWSNVIGLHIQFSFSLLPTTSSEMIHYELWIVPSYQRIIR